MPWTIHSVKEIGQSNRHILPCCLFLLSDGRQKKQTFGWLPCHHGNVLYELEFQRNGDIKQILRMKMLKGKKRGPVTAAGKVISKRKNKFCRDYDKETYLKQAEHAYVDQATWTIAQIYSHSDIYDMDINYIFKLLTRDVENICKRGSPACIPELMYNAEKGLLYIRKILQTLDEYTWLSNQDAYIAFCTKR